MYRIHFTAAGALRTERAVMEFGPDGIRWRFGDRPTPAPSTPSRRRSATSPVMRDFSDRLASIRRRRVRRERLLILLVRLRRLARQQIDSLIGQPASTLAATAADSLNPSTARRVHSEASQENS